MLPPAEQFRGFPQAKRRGGTEYGRDALNDTFGECVVAKANEADCGAQTPKSKARREGVIFYLEELRRTLLECILGKGDSCIKREMRLCLDCHVATVVAPRNDIRKKNIRYDC